MTSQRPFPDGRPTVVCVYSSLQVGAGQLTQAWLERLRGFAAAGWATHAVLLNRDPHLPRTVATLTEAGEFPADTAVHHYAMRDRLIRPSWRQPPPPGAAIDPRTADWLDWLTAQIPGAVVIADSPATYPHVAGMTNPAVGRIAVLHANHLAGSDPSVDPATAPLTDRFAERFEPYREAFDTHVVMTKRQADDLRARFGADLPVEVIPPAVPPPAGALADAVAPAGPALLVSVGPLGERAAGHLEAIAALAEARRAGHDAVLDVVGAGEGSDALLATAGELGVTDEVRIVSPPEDPYAAFAPARLTLWAGRREAVPLTIIRSLALGVPVVARDVRYGPDEVIDRPELGELAADPAALARAAADWLGRPADRPGVRAAAAGLLERTDPAQVMSRWVDLATARAAGAAPTPTLLVEEMSTTVRVPRLAGVLAGTGSPLAAWTAERPELATPAGWLVEASAGRRDEDEDEEGGSPGPQQGTADVRPVFVEVRTNALAHAALASDSAVPVMFSDGTSVTPLLATGFDDRILAGGKGTAIMRRHDDGSVWVHPHREVVTGENVDGRVFARVEPDSAPSDLTHVADWSIEIDWPVTRPGAESGPAHFTGTLRARWVAPAPGAAPALCVRDVGGLSRVVGQLAPAGEAEVTRGSWRLPVRGTLDVAALVATTELARRVLPLHAGYGGLSQPVGVVWTRGRKSPVPVTCDRGTMTLLPSPGGRVLAAPGRGLRARLAASARGVLRRG